LQSLYKQFNYISLEKNLSIQQYIHKFNKINSRINIAEGKFDINQIKSRILNDLPKSYQYFRTTYYLMNQDIAVVNLINLLIQEKQFRKFQRLDKKKEKINTITTNQTNGNKNNNQNINQNTNRRDKCDIYKYKHDGECIIKKDMILKNWQNSDKIKKRLQNKIDQYKKNRIKLDNPITNKNKISKHKSTPLIILTTIFDQYQSTAAQIDLDYSDILDKDSMKVIELSIKSFNKCHE
jgi:hypothetical protein